MLKKWNKPEEMFVNQISDEQEEVPCYQKEQQNIQDAVYGEQLTKKQKEKVEQLIKKDGSNRICVDYRRLNAKTKFDAYPMPRIDDLLGNIGQSKYLTTLDLIKGYWQVQMDERDKEKTAFTSPLDYYNLQQCRLD